MWFDALRIYYKFIFLDSVQNKYYNQIITVYNFIQRTLEMLTNNLDQIADMFIRPQRYKYKLSDLGAVRFEIAEKIVYRIDFQVRNVKQLALKCSVFSINKTLDNLNKVIVYLHCNSGCRLEGLSYLRNAIAEDYGLVLFDFAGSGISEGEYVSLGTSFCNHRKGFHESQDVDCIVKFLREVNQNMVICIWGRSMGAVAALRYVQTDPSIRVAVFDSPFSSLRELALQLGKEQTNLPKFLVDIFLGYLKPSITKKAHFDIDDLDLKTQIHKIKVPGIFVSSHNDKLVPLVQVEQLFKQYKQKKELFLIEEDHNETRKKETLQKLFISVNKYMKLQQNISNQSINGSKNLKDALQPPKRKIEITTNKSASNSNILAFKSMNSANLLETTINNNTHRNDRNNNNEIQEQSRKGPKIYLKDLVSTQKKYPQSPDPDESISESIPLQTITHKINRISSPKFHSKNIKNEIMKETVSDEIFYRKVLHPPATQPKKTALNVNNMQYQENRQSQKASRKTMHLLLSKFQQQDIEDPKSKRISLPKNSTPFLFGKQNRLRD